MAPDQFQSDIDMEDRWELSAEQTPGFGPIAERFRRAGEHDRAVNLCREGLARFPNHLSGRVTLGWALIDLGRFDEARVELERVIKRAPDNLAAIRGLAELHDRAEHDAVFAPAEPATPWPPKPDVAETANGWRDPDLLVTAASPVSSSKSVDEAELSEEELPALLAELEPVVAAHDAAEEVSTSAAAAAAVSDISLEPARAAAIGEQASIDEADSGLVSLQAAMAELDASTPVVSASATQPAQPVVAEFAAVETPNLDEVLSDLTLAETARVADAVAAEPIVDERLSPAAEAPAVMSASEPAILLTDAAPEPAAEEIIDLTSLLPDAAAEVLPVPTVDLLEDVAADAVAEAPAAFEPEAIVLASEPSVELAVGDAAEELFEAAEIPELTTSAPAASLAAVEQPVELDAARPDLDLDLPLDPTLFELARDASAEHAAPAIERAEEVFDLDTEPQFEIAALEQSRDYHEPELALRSSAASVDASDRHRALHDLSLDAPGLTPAADLPQLEFQHSVEIDQVASAGTARDVQFERSFDLSDDFASAMRGGADFASPQISQPEPVEADAAVVAAGFTPPVADGQWSEPEQPSQELEALEAPAAKAEPEARRKRRSDKAPELPRPKPGDAIVMGTSEQQQSAAPAPAQKRVVKPINGLERFLHRIERRKAKLASDSAA